ncbi:TMEM144 [Symbiodinium natans]|uniref:TMEM144 protein n=1 Tax=Symbiodinium natans TaxID=878477 RepID=A0A812IJ60_9DINO|nr:TMEM144 [Symbiodinium natans]
MLFQLVLCLGIWFTGLMVLLLRSNPTFYPVAMSGGVLWCSGNCLTVYIIKQIGLGPGLVTWGTAALIIGWVTGFFGLFGLPSEQRCLEKPWLNVVGLVLAVFALALSTLVRKSAPRKPLLDTGRVPPTINEDEESPRRASTGRTKGVLASLVAGTCYGLNFLPSTWIQNHVAGASQDGLDYVFNQFCGILAASIVYFLIYCAWKNNRPQINPEIMLPGFISGVMWAIAQSCWFVANVDLGYAAAFPIILIGPGFVGSLWSVFLFKEGRSHFQQNSCNTFFSLSDGPYAERHPASMSLGRFRRRSIELYVMLHLFLETLACCNLRSALHSLSTLRIFGLLVWNKFLSDCGLSLPITSHHKPPRPPTTQKDLEAQIGL